MKTVLDKDLLMVKSGRSHRNFYTMRLNPLWNLDIHDKLKWIDKKKTEFMKYRRITDEEVEDENDVVDDSASDSSL